MRHATEPSRRRLVVVSPHLDDAALSLGAAIAYASDNGLPVTVLTVFAGDPGSHEAAGTWDKRSGFATAGEAAHARRVEDRRACEILGAEPVWLPFSDNQYTNARNEQEIWEALERQLTDAALVLIPGHPLAHPDHAWLAGLVTQRLGPSTGLGFYVEQPYASRALLGRGRAPAVAFAAAAIALRAPQGRALQQPPTADAIAGLLNAPLQWHVARAQRQHRRAKFDAIRAYASQLRAFQSMACAAHPLVRVGLERRGHWSSRRSGGCIKRRRDTDRERASALGPVVSLYLGGPHMSIPKLDSPRGALRRASLYRYALRVASEVRRKDSEERLVFVVGSPRSGTTFLGDSLGAQPGFS